MFWINHDCFVQAFVYLVYVSPSNLSIEDDLTLLKPFGGQCSVTLYLSVFYWLVGLGFMAYQPL